jgi:hypothetical protein
MSNMSEQVRTVHEDNDMCILWVSGEVTGIDQVVDWVGGFITPKHDDSQQFSMMRTMPVGNTDGDIIVVLSDELYDENELFTKHITPVLMEWGVSDVV